MQTSTVTPAARGALAALSLATLLPALGASIANIGVPAIAASLQAPFKQVQWVVLAYLLAVTALSVNAGRLGDRLGRRRLLLAGSALFAVASLCCALAPNLMVLVAARIAQGAGAAVMLALAMAMAAGAVSRQRAGSTMGLLGSMSALGTTLGPALGGLLLARYGWPSLFLVNLPLAGLALLLAWRYLPEGRQAPGMPPPRLDLRTEPALAAGLLASALVSTVMMTTLVVGPFYLARGLQLDSAVSGLVLALGPLAAALCGVPAGRLVDRHGARRMLQAGLLCTALACLALALLPASLGGGRLCLAAGGADGRLRPVPGGQQHGHDDGRCNWPARRRGWLDEPVAQPGPGGRRFADGRRVRPGGGRRRDAGAGRRRRARHARRLCLGGHGARRRAGDRTARRRAAQNDATIARWTSCT